MRTAGLLIVLMLLASESGAAPTPPVVQHTANAGYQSGSAGTFTLGLLMVTGPVITPNLTTQEMCRNGVGDESCGTYVVITASGDATITNFVPGPQVRGHRFN